MPKLDLSIVDGSYLGSSIVATGAITSSSRFNKTYVSHASSVEFSHLRVYLAAFLNADLSEHHEYEGLRQPSNKRLSSGQDLTR